MASVQTYTIMGIDPGFASTGFAIATVEGRSNEMEAIQAIGVLESETASAGQGKTAYRYWRAGQISLQVQSIVSDYQVDLIVYEMPFFSGNRAQDFAAGLVMGAVASLDLPTIFVTPQQAKAAASSKWASKRDVVEWAMEATKLYKIPWPKSDRPNPLRLRCAGGFVDAISEHPADALAAIQAGIRTQEWLTAADRPPEYAPAYEQPQQVIPALADAGVAA